MASIKDQLESDIKRFFEQIEKQNHNDQLQTLRNLLDKYIHLSSCDFVMDYHDLSSIVSHAKGVFTNKNFPVFLGKKKRRVYESEQANLCMVEATVSYLNKNDCLKKLPKFDYKEDKF